MSNYQVCITNIEQNKLVKDIKFDNKEDAEHYAKNNSVNDNKHHYIIKKNDRGEFLEIKAYQNGEVIDI
jgi:hypothetical protein